MSVRDFSPGQAGSARRAGWVPLSFAQQRLWFLDRWAPGSAAANLPVAWRLRGPLDANAIAAALGELPSRHEILRTSFPSHGGEPFQAIRSDVTPPLRLLDAPGPGGQDGDDELERILDAEVARPFDLSEAPLLRAALLRHGEDDHTLLLLAHEMVADERSLALLVGELAALYGRHRGDRACPPPPPWQYADFAVWQRGELAAPVLEAALAWWRRRLESLEPLELPADRPRPVAPRGAAALVTRDLAPALWRRVEALARREGVTPLAVALAAFALLLHRYSGQDDVAVGAPFAARRVPGSEAVVGPFANPLVLRTDVGGDPPFRELLGRVREALDGAEAHQELPFERLVDTLRPQRDAARNPLFQVGFALEQAAELALPGVDSTPWPVRRAATRLDLELRVVLDGAGPKLRVHYWTELFERARIERLADHYGNVLEAVTRDPELRAGLLPLLGVQERALLATWSRADADRPPPQRCLHHLVEEQADRLPDQPAVRWQGQEITYAELDRRANRLAHLLRQGYGVGPETIVAVLLDRGPWLPVTQLAVLKTGSAWLPLDPAHPPKRLEVVVSDARCPVAVTTKALGRQLPPGLARLEVDAPALEAELACLPSERPASPVIPADLAYVIYTSGSTGTPKGVMIEHRSAAHHALACRQLYAVTSADRMLQFCNPTFDVSVFETFTTLASGATLVLAPIGTLRAPAALTRLLTEERVTLTAIAPALMALLDGDACPTVRLCFVAGDQFPGELVNRWNRLEREFHNAYGPTETTITMTDHLCPRVPHADSPPIGRPLVNHQTWVLDRHENPAPVGVPGELYIGGVGLARGYLGRPDLTAERFVPNPFGSGGERLYRSGDLVRWRDDGRIEFLGRLDRQVKIRGVRIELGEIEHTLMRHRGVKHAVVTVHTPPGGARQLAAYLVPASAQAPDRKELDRYLAAELPSHMVPASYTMLDALPLNASGKLDRSRLPAPAHPPVATAYAPASTETERELVKVWGELLGAGRDRIGVHDDFFALGGDSLTATRLLSAIRERFHVELPLRALFPSTTVAALAQAVEEAMVAALGHEELARLLDEIGANDG